MGIVDGMKLYLGAALGKALIGLGILVLFGLVVGVCLVLESIQHRRKRRG